jgi:hypothetical protein
MLVLAFRPERNHQDERRSASGWQFAFRRAEAAEFDFLLLKNLTIYYKRGIYNNLWTLYTNIQIKNSYYKNKSVCKYLTKYRTSSYSGAINEIIK